LENIFSSTECYEFFDGLYLKLKKSDDDNFFEELEESLKICFGNTLNFTLPLSPSSC